MAVEWFRSWHGAPTDIKWLALAKIADVPTSLVIAVAWSMLDRASQAEQRGSIAGYDPDALAAFFGCEPEQIEAIVQSMTAKGIVSGLRFASWEKRQPVREDGSAARAKSWRESQREKRERNQTHSNASELDQTRTNEAERQDTDTDTATDTDASLRSENALALVPKGGIFDEFWNSYPNKVGKAAAQRAFKGALKRVELATLMAGLHRYVSKRDDRPWCNPSTWLNQDRWADQPAVALSRSPQLEKQSIADVADRLMSQMDTGHE